MLERITPAIVGGFLCIAAFAAAPVRAQTSEAICTADETTIEGTADCTSTGSSASASTGQGSGSGVKGGK